MLQITEDYAQKCYTYVKKWDDVLFMEDYKKDNPCATDEDVLRIRSIHAATIQKMGMFIIYEKLGCGNFNFQFHGDKASFEPFLELMNITMTDDLDIQPAKSNAENMEFGVEKVFTIRNTVPVPMIESEYDPEITIYDVGKPVVSYLIAAIFGTTNSPPVYCPTIDEIDGEIELKMCRTVKRNRPPVFDFLRPFQYVQPKPKQKKPSKSQLRLLRSALQATALKSESQEKSDQKTDKIAVPDTEKQKCSKSKHQGNARTFKRKTKRSGRV